MTVALLAGVEAHIGIRFE